MLRKLFEIVAFLVLAAVVVLAGFRIHAWYREAAAAQDIAPSNGKFVTTPLGRVHVSLWGAENPDTVVLTHGMAAWGGLWEETAVRIAEQGYQVIAIDQPPFGFSDRANQNFSVSRQAALIDAAMEALDISRYILVGHSYGGGIAMETALRYPVRISRLVLVCPVLNVVADGEEPQKGAVPLLLQSEWIGEVLVAATVTNPLLTGTLAKRFMYRKDSLSARHVAILQRPMALKGNTANMVAWLRQFLTGDVDALSRRPREIARLRMPLALIWGEEDSVVPIEEGDRLAAIVPPVSYARMPQTGHMPQIEDNVLFTHHLLEALDGGDTIGADGPGVSWRLRLTSLAGQREFPPPSARLHCHALQRP